MNVESEHDRLRIKDAIEKHGYIHIKDIHPKISTQDIAINLGQILTPWEDGLIQELRPRKDAAPNTYSGIYGFNQFPFHSDLAHWKRPPHYLLLRCIKGYAEIKTLLIDGLVLELNITREILTRALYKPRRPQNGEIRLLSLHESNETESWLRWDEVFLKPASKIAQIASERITQYVNHASPIAISLVNDGDILLIDNWRMLHARSPILPGTEDRLIERIYMEDLS